ncbi:hypothetical protein AN958_07405 [Leucoagaricus sp. SymC.cos]|nr:hypothetical protein AN958_07405 [Leucoagaricus sp. SymC.cos]
MSQQSGQPSLDQQQRHSAANLIGSGPNGSSGSIGVGGYFPYGPSSSSSSPPPQHPRYPNYNVGSSQNAQYGATSWNGHGSPPPHQPGPGSDGGYTTSSGPGFSPIGAYFNQIPGGPSVGPSVPPSETGSGSGSGGGSGGGGTESGTGAYGAFGASAVRMAKEREAYGAAGSSGRLAVSNAAEGEVPSAPSMPVPMAFPLPQRQQQQHPYYGSSSSPPGRSSASPPPQGEKAELGRNATGTGSGVIVHQDGGRIPDEQGERQEEIPPTYDSLPFGDRR